MAGIKKISGIVSRVGPDWAFESVGLRIMLQEYKGGFSFNLRSINNSNFSMTKIGDQVSFDMKETGLFKKYWKVVDSSFVNHTILEESK